MMQYHKRIQELYEQAHVTQEKRVRVGGWDNDREPFEYHNVTETVFDPEKFAELIIKECIKLNSKELSITAIERLLPLYEEHFGIEE